MLIVLLLGRLLQVGIAEVRVSPFQHFTGAVIVYEKRQAPGQAIGVALHHLFKPRPQRSVLGPDIDKPGRVAFLWGDCGSTRIHWGSVAYFGLRVNIILHLSFPLLSL